MRLCRLSPWIAGASLVLAAAPTLAATPQALETVPQVPATFIENRGQLGPAVSFSLAGRDRQAFFGAGGVTLALTDGGRRHAVRLEFPGARSVAPAGRGRSRGVVSYFKGAPDSWTKAAPTWASLVYEQLWPGIDLVFDLDRDQLKYRFEIAPGADPDRIRVRFRGADGVTLAGDGALLVATSAGTFRDERPVAHQETKSGRREVAARYATAEASSWRIALGPHDRRLPLVVDPQVVVYSGFLGGLGLDEARGAAVDGSGHLFVVGHTESSQASFPVTLGPDLTYGGVADAFVAKLDPDGQLVYAGYIGGSRGDEALAVAVDGAGNAYVAGSTLSTQADGFPLLTGPDLTHNGGQDAFLTVVNASGTGLVYSGYVGGAATDAATAVAVESGGVAYVGGYTTSATGFPATVGPDLTPNGGTDGWVARVSPAGGLLYCGFLGGSGEDVVLGIATEGSRAYLAGWTTSTPAQGFPVAVGPALTHSGGRDGFVARVDSTGTSLEFAGYVGGTGDDDLRAIAVDASGSAYATGSTQSSDYPVVGGPASSLSGPSDAVVAKLQASGSALVYSGYLGGPSDDSGEAIAVDSAGRAHVAGTSGLAGSPPGRPAAMSIPFPGRGGCDSTPNGGLDAFLVRLLPDGSIDVGGYLGGSGDDVAHALALGGSGDAYLAGGTTSHEPTFPVVRGPQATNQGGAADAFVARLSPCFAVDTTADSVDSTPGDGICSDLTGQCSLRAAVMEANLRPGRDAICLPPGTYSLTIGSEDGTAAAGDLDIVEEVDINGSDASEVFVEDPAGNKRLFHIRATAQNVDISRLTIRGGDGGVTGGGCVRVAAGASARLYEVKVAHCSSEEGGAIQNLGTLAVERSEVSDSTAYTTVVRVPSSSGGGGAIYNGPTGVLTLDGSALLRNSADAGGAIENAGSLLLRNSTVSENSAPNGGGLLASAGSAVIENSTITGNTASSGDGGGILRQGGASVQMLNSVLAGNLDLPAGAPDCSTGGVSLVSLGYNLLGNDSGCAFSATTGDQVGSAASPLDPQLGPLADNGGPVRTHALLGGSPAFNLGSPALPGSGGDACQPVDARGFPRPTAGRCDVGGYEGLVNASADLAVGIAESADPILVGNTVKYSVGVTNNIGDTATGTILRVKVSGPGSLVGISVFGTCDVLFQAAICQLADIGEGTTNTVDFSVTGDSPGTVTLDVSVSANLLETAPGNETATETTTVVGCGKSFDNDGSDGLWGNPLNWSGDTLPGPADDVCIAAPFTVSLLAAIDGTIHSLSCDGSLIVAGGLLAPAIDSYVAGSYTQSSGTLDGTGNLTLKGSSTWSGGIMTGSGLTVVAPGGSLLLSGGALSLAGRTVQVEGSATWQGGFVTASSGGTLHVFGGATFDIQSDQTWASGAGGGAILNGGLLVKSATAGTTTIAVPVSNIGEVRASLGFLNFTGSYTQTAGLTRLQGGFMSTTSQLDIQGGELSGAGQITGFVTNSGGVVKPGLSPGNLQITGNYNQGAGGTLEVELGGLAQGTQYDLLAVVGGTANLAGTLNVVLFGGFDPALGDAFKPLTFAARSGSFDSVVTPTLSGGRTWQVVYNANDLTLTVAGGACPPLPGYEKTWVSGTPTPGDWSTAGNWSPSGVPTATDDVYICAAASAQPIVSVNVPTKDLLVEAGANVATNAGTTITAAGNVDASGPIGGAGKLTMTGVGVTLRGMVPNLEITGSTSLLGTTQALGQVISKGTLTLAGQTLMAGGGFATQTATGTLVMTNPADVLDVSGNVAFTGGSTAGTLSAGQLLFTGDFSENSGFVSTAFAASGSHLTVFRSPVGHAVGLVHAGSGSQFQTMQVQAPFLTLLTPVVAGGSLIEGTPAVARILGGQPLSVSGLDVDGLVFDSVPLISTGGTITRFDNVTFQNMAPSATQLTLDHPGAAGMFVFNNTRFLGAPSTGLYVSSTDSDGGPQISWVRFVNSTPCDGSAFTQQINGALVSWPCQAHDLTISDASALEGDAGTSPIKFVVSLSPASPDPVLVDYATADLDATAGVDYQPAAGTLSFAPGATQVQVQVQILGDLLPEIDEAFKVELTNPLGATLLDDIGDGQILDDDSCSSFRVSSVEQVPADTLTSAAVGADGLPRAGYVKSGDVRYAFFDGQAWQYETVDTGALSDSSMALGPDGEPGFAYIKGGRLNYAKRAPGGGWALTVVPGSYPTLTGQRFTLRFSPAGQPSISFVTGLGPAGPWNLAFASFDGSSWTVDSGLDAQACPHVSHDFEPGGAPVVAYCKFPFASEQLWRASLQGGSWTLGVIDDHPASTDRLGFSNQLRALPGGGFGVAYYNLSQGNLLYASAPGFAGPWTAGSVETVGDVGDYAGLAVFAGRPRVSYISRNNEVRYAEFSGGWLPEPVDPGNVIGTSVATDARGGTHLTWYDRTTAHVRHAQRAACLADFGDAPAPYPTTAAQDGASHQTFLFPRGTPDSPQGIPIVHLGLDVDLEPDGQPDAIATGDDASGIDDEDGVVFGGPLIGGSTASVAVEVTAIGSGVPHLDAWVDFDRNGSWADPGEQIFTSQAVSAGPNLLTFPVPASTVAGNSFARFRISWTGGLLPTGPAPSGEVEDHQVTLLAQPTADLSIVKAASLAVVPLAASFDYTLTIANGPTTPATGVVVQDSLPPQVTLVSAVASQGSCTGTTTLVCNLGSLAAGSTATVTITVSADVAAAAVSNTATVSATEVDPDPTNNTSSTTVRINAPPSISSLGPQTTLEDAPLGPLAFTVGDDFTPLGSLVVTALTDNPTLFPGGVALGGSLADRTLTLVPAADQFGTALVTLTVTDADGAKAITSFTVTATPVNDPPTLDPIPDTTVSLAAGAQTVPLTGISIGPANEAPQTLTVQALSGNTSVVPTPTVTYTSPNATGSLQFTPIAAGTALVTVGVKDSGGTANNGADTTTRSFLVTVTGGTPTADVGITKVAASTSGVGQPLVYTLTATNAGPSVASGVTVFDYLPSGVDFVSAAGCTRLDRVVTCSVGNLALAASAVFTVTVTPTASTASLGNSALVTSTSIDPNPDNDLASVTTLVLYTADLHLTMADAPDPALAGQPLTYSLTLTNSGPSAATAATVSLPLPAGASFVSASTGCSLQVSTVVCSLGTLEASGLRSLGIVVRPGVPGSLLATASASSGEEFDPTPSDNQASVTTSVVAAADLSVSVTATPEPVTVNADLTYELTVSNLGPQAATGAVLYDYLPSAITPVSVPTACTVAGRVVACPLGSLAASQVVHLTFVVRPTQAPASLTNAALVVSQTADPASANDTATVTSSVVGVTAAAQIIAPAPGSVLPGSSVTFSWTPISGASGYWLDLGRTPGSRKLASQSAGTATSMLLSGLPQDGSILFVRLWTMTAAGWAANDYSYQAGSAASAIPAHLTAPTPGSTLPGSNVTFAWDGGQGVRQYWLDIGSSPGASDLFSGPAGTATSLPVSGLPRDGRAVYVRLWSQLPTQWAFDDQAYTASGPQGPALDGR